MTGRPLWWLRAGGRQTAAGLAVAVAGCAGAHHVLDPSGPEAVVLYAEWRVLLAVCAVVYAAVLTALVWASTGRSRGPASVAPLACTPAVERRLGRAVALATLLTAVTIVGLATHSFVTARALSAVPPDPNPVTISVTGHQWWWALRYDADSPDDVVVAANEMHVPLRRTVQLHLTSSDVIHSIWAPNLTGKRDLIPGHVTTLAFSVDRPGVYRAPCAEFCGVQHALMALIVVAEPEDAFQTWLARQRTPAGPPGSPAALRGEQVFMHGQCPLCHRIAGTAAGGQVAPDLTHLASRRTLAAGTLPNTRGHLAGWIVDPQRVKPGVKMPMTDVAPADLQALLDYLQGLR